MAEIDKAKAEEFSGRMMGIVNDAFLGFMLSIGHQTGLLNKMAKLPPSTSEEIASAAGLNERYVREWLGALVTGRVVNYDPEAKSYHLPAEHAASITEAAGSENVANWMQFLSCIGSVEQEVVESFRNGGGVPYTKYERFHKIMREESGETFKQTLLQSTLPLVPGLTDRMGGGISVLDVGCGSGRAINLMAKAFPNSRFRGFDFSVEAVEAARHEAEQWGLKNAEFEVHDVARMPTDGGYDFITAFDSIHDQAHPRKVLANINGALHDQGTFLMVDINASSRLEKNLDNPLAPFLYSISTMHCMSVSLGLDGEGLGTCWGEELARELLGEAGFTGVEVKQVEGDPFNSFYLCQKG